MSDETPQQPAAEKGSPTSSDWVMPEPIFRSTVGYTPGAGRSLDNSDEVETETPDLEPPETEPQSDNPLNVPTTQPDVNSSKPVGKRGCGKTLVVTVGIVGLLATAIIIAMVYFLLYYRPTGNGQF